MHLQYLSDYTGKHTAVVIPIQEWEDIVRKHSDLKALVQEQPEKKYTFGDFDGILTKEQGEELLRHVEQSRNEWDRDS
jgi:hypothetical protein